MKTDLTPSDEQASVIDTSKMSPEQRAALELTEAARCLEEGLVETPGDVDFAMVMGTGFAPFLGGPLRYSDSQGTAKIVGELARLASEAGPHYEPCARLHEMAKAGKCFYEN